MSAYDLGTHLGAYLSKLSKFLPNGAVGFVNTELLDGYADTSGKDSTRSERVLTVNGCLSQGEQWGRFADVWQAYLKKERFKPDPKTDLYVFHTAAFHSDNCKLMPNGLTKRDKQRIYSHLVGLVRDHSEYCFGFAVLLEDYRRFLVDYQGAHHLFKQPGTFMSQMCFKWNSIWAMNTRNFNPSISYMFDQGDEFWHELGEEYRVGRQKVEDPNDATVSSLSDGSRAKFSPLQAADVVAWECRNYLRSLSKGHLTGIVSPKTPSPEFQRLAVRGKSNFNVFLYEDLVKHFHATLERATKLDAEVEKFLGEGNHPYSNLDELGRDMLKTVHEEKERERQEVLDDYFAKKKERREKRNEKGKA